MLYIAHYGQHKIQEQIRDSFHRKQLGFLLALKRNFFQEHKRIVVPHHLAKDNHTDLHMDDGSPHAVRVRVLFCIRKNHKTHLQKITD